MKKQDVPTLVLVIVLTVVGVVLTGCNPLEPGGGGLPRIIILVDGDIPPVMGSYAFGEVSVGGNGATVSVEVRNEGDEDLKVSDVTCSGTDADSFAPDSAAPFAIGPDSKSAFDLTFSPTSIGQKHATLSVTSNDPDVPTYSIQLSGTGTAGSMSVYQGNIGVSAGGEAHFGYVCVDTVNTVTFVVCNDGNQDLSLIGSPLVDISGTDAASFSLASNPASGVSPGAETSFAISFETANATSKTATVSIESDDPTVAVYQFTITGCGFIPALELPETGKKASLAPRDDGDLEMGATWPEPRFVDNGDETITDKLTGLMWDKNANRHGRLDWSTALTTVSGLTHATYSDWRLPNIVEMLSLVNRGQSGSTSWLTSVGFVDVQSSPDVVNYRYWTGTHASEGRSYSVNLLDGTPTSLEYAIAASVWAVRDAGPGAVGLRASGQTTSYATGDDGDLQVGVVWPDPRFIDNGNGTFSDLLTGLMWEQAPGGIDRETWSGAIAYATASRLAGYTDWRVPNLVAFQSLVNYEYADSTNGGWLFSQGFLSGSAGYRWSSTPYWVIHMGSGRPWAFDRNVYNYLWIVRGRE